MRSRPPVGDERCRMPAVANVLFFLLDAKGETALATPLVVKVAVVCAETAAVATAGRTKKQVHTSTRTLYRIVHGDDHRKAHLLDLLVRELVTDETSDFDIGLSELPTLCFGEDEDPVAEIKIKDFAIDDSDINRDAGIHWPKVLGMERALRKPINFTIFAFKALDPLLPTHAVRGDREVDDPVLYAPASDGSIGLSGADLAVRIFHGTLLVG